MRLTFDKINRRTHLYAALFFLPWFFMYGLSSAVFSHPKWFGEGPAPGAVLFDRDYRLPPGGDLRALADRIQHDNALPGYFAVFRDGAGNLVMYQSTFFQSREVRYDAARQRLTETRHVFPLANLLTNMHGRGGFQRPGFLEQSWSVLVDAVQLSILVWILSGIYMWWHLRHLRGWGFLALGGGILSFLLFMLKL